MLRSREAAKALENIVGPDNLSEDPAVISSYTFQGMGFILIDPSLGPEKDGFDVLKLGAVILPGSTEEVQAIVKVCNKYRINFKASSTALGSHGLASKEGSLQLDMRRMNRIIRIDPENMYAIVEPYVSAIELVKELWKLGLTYHIIGAGSQHSILASVTNQEGFGASSMTTSDSPRNSLGEEWVTPTGEIVTWGLVEEGKVGHPGIGMRGIYRGQAGPMGCLGVMTKVAVKLYAWPGPAKFEITGRHPTRGWKTPDNFKVYLLGLPSTKSWGNAVYKLAEAKIAYHVWSYPTIYHVSKWMLDSNDEHVDLWQKLEEAGVLPKSVNPLAVIIAGYSQKELTYKEKVMNDIISEVGAYEYLAGFMTDHDKERFLAGHLSQHKQCSRMRLGVGGGDPLLQHMPFDEVARLKDPTEERFKEYVKKGVLTDSAGSSFWGGPHEQSPWGHSEYVSFSHLAERGKTKPEVLEGQRQLGKEMQDYAEKERLVSAGVNGGFPFGDRRFGKYLDNFLPYKMKIKEAMDPNGVADPLTYQY